METGKTVKYYDCHFEITLRDNINTEITSLLNIIFFQFVDILTD